MASRERVMWLHLCLSWCAQSTAEQHFEWLFRICLSDFLTNCRHHPWSTKTKIDRLHQPNSRVAEQPIVVDYVLLLLANWLDEAADHFDSLNRKECIQWDKYKFTIHHEPIVTLVRICWRWPRGWRTIWNVMSVVALVWLSILSCMHWTCIWSHIWWRFNWFTLKL